jgi:hypothetical protein
MEFKYDAKWLDETIERFPGGQKRYRLMCLLLFKRRMTYGNLYVLTYGLYKDKFKDNEEKLKSKILKDLAYIYYYNNNRLPDGFEYTTE